MASAATLKLLAFERLRDAECLIANGHAGAAYYIGGYAIELALKAVVCKRLNIEIFEREVVPRHIAKSFMIHDLLDLLILSGLTNDLENACIEDYVFQVSWTRIAIWSEQRRYELGCSATKVEVFVISLKIVMQWLQQHW
ncbi:MAG: hypothetical protein J7619_02700 [Dyadobacter sp.]|uniref:hypothetical protein n=1 Tax=Dyadobacter sp. TaxID=1914288 RepID=UPI001B0F3229|nr:hypothetical protein [Dyadobacter sp.]MBO9611573.1 hypothetical protein [Dyadobacter sp.]